MLTAATAGQWASAGQVQALPDRPAVVALHNPSQAEVSPDGPAVVHQGPGAGRQDVIVQLLIDQHIRRAEAKALYDDVTPAPSAEEIEWRRMERLHRAATRAAGTPDRRQRRELRRAKERG